MAAGTHRAMDALILFFDHENDLLSLSGACSVFFAPVIACAKNGLAIRTDLW
jgi:hypothetical protein